MASHTKTNQSSDKASSRRLVLKIELDLTSNTTDNQDRKMATENVKELNKKSRKNTKLLREYKF